MGNPLFGNQNGPIQNGNVFGPFGGMANFVSQLNQFAGGLQGDPQQMIQQLRQSGQMSDAQFNQCSQLANQIMPLLSFLRR